MKGGVYAYIAQMMFSFELGGVVYSHGVAEGNWAANVPPVAFFALTVWGGEPFFPSTHPALPPQF